MQQLKYMYHCRLCGKQFHSATARWSDHNITMAESAIRDPKPILPADALPIPLQILHTCCDKENNHAFGVADFIGIIEF